MFCHLVKEQELLLYNWSGRDKVIAVTEDREISFFHYSKIRTITRSENGHVECLSQFVCQILGTQLRTTANRKGLIN